MKEKYTKKFSALVAKLTAITIFFGVPLIPVYLVSGYLGPITYWERLASLIVYAIIYITGVTVEQTAIQSFNLPGKKEMDKSFG